MRWRWQSSIFPELLHHIFLAYSFIWNSIELCALVTKQKWSSFIYSAFPTFVAGKTLSLQLTLELKISWTNNCQKFEIAKLWKCTMHTRTLWTTIIQKQHLRLILKLSLTERCENKICPGTLKERNLLKQKRKIVKFWRSFFSFVFKSVLFWYHIIITSFYFRDPLKQAADQRSITFSWFFHFCFVLDSSRAFGR